MAQIQQINTDIHNGNNIIVLDEVIVDEANDNIVDYASSQDSGDAPNHQREDQWLDTAAEVDIQEQWRFLQKRKRELAAEKKLLSNKLRMQKNK